MFSRSGLLAFSLVALFYIPTSLHATDLHNWSKRFGGTGADAVTGLAWPQSEGFPGFITGVFADTIAFGASSLASAGGSDVFLVRLDYNGVPAWSRRMGGELDDVAYAITKVADGVIVVGAFEGTANFGGADLTSAGGTDIFVVKYTSGGDHVFSWRFGGSLDDVALGISGVNPFYVTGYFGGTLNFGGNDLTSAGGRDIFVARWHGNGTHEWSYAYGGALDDVGAAISTTSSFAVVVGSFAGTANFGGSNQISAGGSDIFYAQYNTLSGAHERSARFGGTADDFGTEVVATFGGSFYFTGSFRETANFGGGTLASYGGSDAFLAAYNTAGVHLWSKRLGGPLDDHGNGISDFGILTLTGSFAGTANLGGGPRTSAGGTDAFLAKFEPGDGFHRSSQAFGGPLDDAGTAVAIHRSWIPEDYGSDPILVGSFNGTVDFGGGPLTSEGETDAFVLDLSDAFTGVGDAPQKGSVTVSCFPNPFNPRTSVIYTVPANAPVMVAVFDPSGAHVATLVNREHRNSGEHRVEWDGRADVGGLAASGIYFVRVEQLGVASATKLVLLK